MVQKKQQNFDCLYTRNLVLWSSGMRNLTRASQMLVYKYVDQNSPAAMLATERLAGVAPEVNSETYYEDDWKIQQLHYNFQHWKELSQNSIQNWNWLQIGNA